MCANEMISVPMYIGWIGSIIYQIVFSNNESPNMIFVYLNLQDFTLLREAREQRRLRNQLSSAVSPISISFSTLPTNTNNTNTNTTTRRFIGGLSSANSYDRASYNNNNNTSCTNNSNITFHAANLGRGLLQHSMLGISSSSSTLGAATPLLTSSLPQQSQNRTFFTNLKQDIQLKQLERIANQNPHN